jgi:tRNA G37 N-methylase Trm5
MGLYERELHGWFDRFSKGARTVIDGGGGYGYYSSYFLVKTEVEKVFCFEPNSEQREEMRRTFVLNNVHRDDRMSLFSKYITKDNSDTHATLDSLMDRIQWGCPNDG